jgi:hypothetical protein
MTATERFPSEPRGTGATSPPGSTPGMTEKLQDTASRVADTVQDAAAPVLDQAGERASQVADQVMDQATSRMDLGKEYAVETLTGVAQALRQTGQHLREDSSQPTLGQYADTGAQQLERFTGYLHQRDTNQLLSEVESYARRNPTIFAGGAFALGLLAARFFRSSGQRSQTRSVPGGTPSGSFSPLAPSRQAGTHAGMPPRPTTGQRPGPLSTAPAARNIPPSPEWSPSTPGRASTGTNTGTADPQADQRTPVPGSQPSLGTSASRPSGSPPVRPGSGTGATTPDTDRPQPGSRTAV